jgi:predicted nucleotidyltransferase component of viral defense system
MIMRNNAGGSITLPRTLDPSALADLCRETSFTEHVDAYAIEKDYYLTRILWAIGQAHGSYVLLKGGTLLSKVDLGFRRMSEDVDLTIAGTVTRYRKEHMQAIKPFRDSLASIGDLAGLQLDSNAGQESERGSHVIWSLQYESEFGPQSIDLEISLHPVLRPPRHVGLKQLLIDPLIGDLTDAFCWAFDENEARAEKVRAAFSRREIRDYYDLGALLDAGKDFQSDEFRTLVDLKLSEVSLEPLSDQPASFGLTPESIDWLLQQTRKGLSGLLRADENAFDLQRTLDGFNYLWGKR